MFWDRIVKEAVIRRYCIEILKNAIREAKERLADKDLDTSVRKEYEDIQKNHRQMLTRIHKDHEYDKKQALKGYRKQVVYPTVKLLKDTAFLRARTEETVVCDVADCRLCKLNKMEHPQDRTEEKMDALMEKTPYCDNKEQEYGPTLEHLLARVDRVLSQKAGKLPGGPDAVAELILSKCCASRGTTTGKVMSFSTFERAMIDGKAFKDNFCITCTHFKTVRALVEQFDKMLDGAITDS